MSKEISKTDVYSVPAGFEFEETKETLTQADMALPFLKVLQPLSPQVKKSDQGYVEGAEEGMFYNTVTKEFTKKLLIVPVHYKRSFLEWTTRENGAGYVAEHPVSMDSKIKKVQDSQGRWIVQEGSECGTPGNQIVETATYYVYTIDPETKKYSQAVFSMSNSQFFVAKQWNASHSNLPKIQMGDKMIMPARYFMVWRFVNKIKSNDKGSWWSSDYKLEGTVPEVLGDIGKIIFEAAKDFADNIKEDNVKVDMNNIDDNQKTDDEVTF